jgi:hypothetical protein
LQQVHVQRAKAPRVAGADGREQQLPTGTIVNSAQWVRWIEVELALNKKAARAVAGSTSFQRIIPEIFVTEQY